MVAAPTSVTTLEPEVSLSDDSVRQVCVCVSRTPAPRLVIDGPGLGSQIDLELWLQACPVAVEVHLHSSSRVNGIPNVEFSTIVGIGFGVNRQDLPPWDLGQSEKRRRGWRGYVRLVFMFYVGWVACHESLPIAGEVKRNAKRNVEHGINPLIPAYALASYRKASAIFQARFPFATVNGIRGSAVICLWCLATGWQVDIESQRLLAADV
ncbi:hypothetical protein R3P38DRAFT_2795706 [Favolaschia claudopus]|uniref:Uncharacterized protein n=1 Tax=Favolaschia claudopus TaxID=2862362 RepID=A0AAW0A6I4_9AGAR